MTTSSLSILHLDSSPRGERSHSRLISREVVEGFQKAHPDARVTYRDLGRDLLPAVSEDWVLGAFAPPESQTDASRAAIAVSDEAIAELKNADILIAGVPMYNFSIPASFKLWVDQIVRANVTFSVPGFEGLLPTGKRAIIVTARGAAGYGPGEAMEAMNAEDPYLRLILGFIGLKDIEFIHLEGTNSDEVRAQSLDAARSKIQQLVAA